MFLVNVLQCEKMPIIKLLSEQKRLQNWICGMILILWLIYAWEEIGAYENHNNEVYNSRIATSGWKFPL